ncbi:hypothetical protein BJX61DRAFT_531838 [Aspergillus egyptiacus]|nr:hypothetical protein BJX61DRAFT_531838 [Aspergillus egyptiacus]
MDSDSDTFETSGKPRKDLLEPAILFLSGRCVFAEGAPSTPLYQCNSNIQSVSNRDSSALLERVQRNEAGLDAEPESSAAGASSKHLFWLVHPANSQYRTDIPARYFITAADSEMLGNIRLEISEPRLQRTSFKAKVGVGKTAASKPLFDEEQVLLFDIRPRLGLNASSYQWSNSSGHQVAVEEKHDDRHKLSITRSMTQQSRDALVTTWLLRLWHQTADSRQAKREFYESMTTPEILKENMNTLPRAYCILM